MEPLPILPPNVWPGQIPAPSSPEYKIYQEFVEAYAFEDPAVYVPDDNVTLRALAYDCVTIGTNSKVGHEVTSAITAELRDSHTHYIWGLGVTEQFHEDSGAWGSETHTVISASDELVLPPSENLPPAMDSLGISQSDETSFNPSEEPILSAQYTGGTVTNGFFLFLNVEVPKSAKINYAYVRFVSGGLEHDLYPSTIQANIGAWDTSNVNPSDVPASYNDAGDVIDSMTNSRVDWTVQSEEWIEGNTYETSNLACVVQTIIDKNGWESGNGIQLVFLGDATGGSGASSGNTLYVKGYADGTNAVPELHVFYETAYLEEMHGGVIVQVLDRVVKLGGTAVVSKRFSSVSTGGVKLNGNAPNSNSRETDEQMLGGVTVSGSNINFKLARINMLGGIKLGGAANQLIYVSGMMVSGSADVQFVYDATRKTDEWDVIASAGKNIPQESHNFNARCWFYIANSRLYYRITHNDPAVNLITLNGPAGLYETAGVVGALPAPYSSPIAGSVPILPEQAESLRNGLGYIQLSDGVNHFRSQIAIPGYLGGQAAIYNELVSVETEGGIVAAGTARQFTVRNARMYSGITLGGTADVQTTLVMPRRDRAGIKLNGTCGTSAIFEYVDLKAGARIGGRITSFVTFVYKVVADGGVMCDTTNTYSHYLAVAIDGSLVIGGATVANRILWPRPQGGLKIDGSLRLNFTDQVEGRAGVRLGGKTPLAYEKFFESVRNGYCRAMASENICTTTPPRTDLLITSDISPILEDYLPTLESAGWCDATERCSLGILPKIVKNRQGQYLPPKQPVRRRATSLTQRSTTRIS